MREPENIRALFSIKPDFVGFIFYPKSPRYVGDQPEQEAFESVSKHANKVAVFVNEAPEQVRTICSCYGFEYAQLHGKETAFACKKIRESGLKVIKTFSVDEDFDFETIKEYENTADYFLFDTKCSEHGGSGKKFDWELLNNYKGEAPFFLSGGISIEDIKTVKQIKHPKLYAIDINSKFEIEPGVKDNRLVAMFKYGMDTE
ncbi:MAG: phosphoribosylanthranilate isomerase [Lachnospirales bacterium]